MSAGFEIPCVEEPNAETGLVNSTLAMWLFLASEVMLFGALFSTYVILRLGALDWPQGSTMLNVPLATANTFVLICSSVTMAKSRASLGQRDIRKFRLYMGLTVLLAAVFLGIKRIEYTGELEHGLLPSTSTFMAIYFIMTGLHALHVMGGMAVNAYLFGPGSALWESRPRRFTNRVTAAGLYWHFVDVVWIVLFSTLYLT